MSVQVMDEKVSIVGYRDVSFTDDSGKQVNGRSYYYIATADGVVGVTAGKMFVSANSLKDMKYKPAVGDEVYVFYNRYGKPYRFQKI